MMANVLCVVLCVLCGFRLWLHRRCVCDIHLPIIHFLHLLHPIHHKDTAWIALLGAFIAIAITNPHDALQSHVEWETLLFFAGLFVLVEVCAAMGLLRLVGNGLATYIESQAADNQLTVPITLLIWVSAITSAYLDSIPYTVTMIPIVRILDDELPDRHDSD